MRPREARKRFSRSIATYHVWVEPLADEIGSGRCAAVESERRARSTAVRAIGSRSLASVCPSPDPLGLAAGRSFGIGGMTIPRAIGCYPILLRHARSTRKKRRGRLSREYFSFPIFSVGPS